MELETTLTVGHFPSDSSADRSRRPASASIAGYVKRTTRSQPRSIGPTLVSAQSARAGASAGLVRHAARPQVLYDRVRPHPYQLRVVEQVLRKRRRRSRQTRSASARPSRRG